MTGKPWPHWKPNHFHSCQIVCLQHNQATPSPAELVTLPCIVSGVSSIVHVHLELRSWSQSCTELGSVCTYSSQGGITHRTYADTWHKSIYRTRWYQVVPRIIQVFNSTEDPAAAFQLWLQPRLQAAVCYLKQKGTLFLLNMWTSCGHYVNTRIKQWWCGQTTSDSQDFVTGYL